MRAEDLIFWLDAIGEGPGPDRGVLCQRHGDSMVVPRGWTLDDLRDPDLHLFRPPKQDPDQSGGHTRRRRVAGHTVAEQLALGGIVEAEREPEAASEAASPVGHDDAVAEPADEPAAAWKPAFDDADDLDGLLSARSPLLSRAFRTTDRAD